MSTQFAPQEHHDALGAGFERLDPDLSVPLLDAFFAAPSGVAVLDLSGRVQTANAALWRLLGHAAEPPTALVLASAMHPADARPFGALFAELADGERSAGELEVRFLQPDGETAWGQVSTSLVRDAKGSPRYVACVVHDIDDRKEAERLRAALASSERLRTLGQMAGGVAHDLNQALALIAGHGDLARRALDPRARDDAGLRQSVETMARAAVDGGHMVRRLLAFSRGETRTEPALLEVGELLRDVASLTAPRWRDAARAQGRPIELRVQVVDGEPMQVRGWPHALREALTNMVFNAVDAMPLGGTIVLAAGQVGETVYVQVQDTGSGMPPEVQERIFDAFFTTKGEQGTGLGLPQVAETVQQHEGSISVQSAIGRGTTFTIALPVAEAAARAVASTPPTAAPWERREVGTLRILVVDDEPRLLEMLAAMLDQHTIRSAASAEEAVALLSREPADLVISDLGMGGAQNGWDLAAQVRQRWPETRFALATGWGAFIDEAELRQRGAVALLSKPFRAEDLEALIQQVA